MYGEMLKCMGMSVPIYFQTSILCLLCVKENTLEKETNTEEKQE